MDSNFNQDATFTDDIILDQTPPTVVSASITVPPNTRAAAARVRHVVHVVARDTISGVGRIEYASSRHARGGFIAYGRRLIVNSLRAARWVRAVDRAGNRSRWKRVVIVHRRT
jgi:hypothetical protein